jgi:hypothetical protein
MKINLKEGLLMKIETKQKIKEFYERRKVEIIIGSTIIGGIVIACILKPKQGETKLEIIEVLPDWAEKYKQKCDNENLLYENGLPMFANDECTIIYKDALADEYSVNDAENDGFIVIERA